MSEIRNLTRNGETFYPLTHAEGVLDPEGNYIGNYEENPEYVRVELDSDGKILRGIRKDGVEVLGAGYEVDRNVTTTIDNPEFIIVYLDSQDHILWGIRKDGSIFYTNGISQEIKDYINKIIFPLISNKVDKEEGKSLINSEVAEGVNYTDSPEFISIDLDSNNRVLSGRRINGVKIENVGFETPNISINGTEINTINDPEGRIEIGLDSKKKIYRYRKTDGTLVENVGIVTRNFHSEKLTLPNDALEQSYQYNNNHPIGKNWYLPKFGKVNVKSETFYLTADQRWNTKDDVVCIQMLDDTDANAGQRLTLSYYYIKSTLVPLAGGGYDRTSVNENSVRLDLFPGKDVGKTFGVGSDGKTYFTDEVTKVGGIYYVTSSLVDGQVGPNSIEVTESQDKVYYVKKIKLIEGNYYLSSTTDNDTGAMQQVDYKGEIVNNKPMISVLPVTDVPPYKAWCVNKNPEHYCVADIDFGDFYKKNNVPCSIKYQGAGSTAMRKRGLRFTFYKKNDYKKKDKIKIGEFVRLSGFNMKSYALSPHRLNDPILSNIFIEMWENRGKDCYPWNKDSIIYNGATGFIKSFPIETWWGDEFYGLQFFSEKKDEKNYMLDGDDDSSGCFLSGVGPYSGMLNPIYWDDEMGVEGRTLAYPSKGDDSVSVETAAALTELFKYIQGFIDGEIEINGEVIPFTRDMLEERLDIASVIDYWIGLEMFVLYDSVYNNVILYSGADKKKFSLFFYDLDGSLKNRVYTTEITPQTKFMDICEGDPFHMNMDFWKKILDVYKDSIINRYTELRKTVLTDSNVEGIYLSYVGGIPQNVVDDEVARWSGGNPYQFEEEVEWIKNRLRVLDSSYFNL